VLLYNTLPGGETAYEFESLDFDPVTNKIYGVNDDSDQQGRGIYSFDLTAGTLTKIVASPDYRRIENDFDGLATGGGLAFLTTDEPGFVYRYDLVANNGQWIDFLSPVLTDSGLFGGAAYAAGLIPEPTTATVGLAAATMMLALRRRTRRLHSDHQENAITALNIRHASLTMAVLGAAALSATSASAQTITTLIREGNTVPGVGTVTGTDGYAVNNSGEWIVEAATNNPDANSNLVLLRTGVQYWRENDAFGGANLSSWDDHSLNNNSELAGNLFLRPTSPTDSGIHFNKTMTIQESTVSTAPQFTAGTPYVGWFGVKMNDSRQGVMVASVDDLNIATTVDRAMVAYTVSAGGALLSENAFAKEGDLLPGAATAVSDFETDSNEFDQSNTGHVLYGATLVGATNNNAIYRWDGTTNNLVAIEGGSSPAAGRTWSSLSSPRVALSGNGLHYAHTGVLSGDTATDNVIVVNGAVYKQEGDTVTTASGTWAITTFATQSVLVDDAGNVVWYGDWNDPVTTQDQGIFYNNQLIVQEGVTQIEGLTVVTVRAFSDTLVMSDNGQYILFEAELTGGLEGAFMIQVPEPTGALTFVACGFALARRRKRGQA
jgi:hypothetical protein